jgi:dTDP-glucose 4,6-dehydratase
MEQQRLPAADLEFILQETMSMWEEMRNRRIFITGGTGFFGRWLLESFLQINQVLGLNARATVLSRDPKRFADRAPHIATDPAITLLAGDVSTFDFPEGEFEYVIHAATEVAIVKAIEEPLERLMAIQGGTARTLQFAATHGTRKFLLTSSGAVYGRQPVPASAYGEGKRASELMCALYAVSSSIDFKIARCFAFAGPGLALDANFAIGNFIGDVMLGRSVAIAGDGTPLRSYLYAADLAVWLWTMLFRAPSLEIFNVGSEEAISIADLARRVVTTLDPQIDVKVAKRAPEGNVLLQYVPSTQKAQRMLNLRQTVGLNESIRRMAEWNGYKSK